MKQPLPSLSFDMGTYSWKSITQLKPVSKSISQNSSSANLSLLGLIAYGISATVGSGIYAAVGRASLEKSGPSIVISILIAGFMSLITAFAYLEFASKIPTSGSCKNTF